MARYLVIAEEGMPWRDVVEGPRKIDVTPTDEYDRLTQLADIVISSLTFSRDDETYNGAYAVVMDLELNIYRIDILTYIADFEYDRVNIARVSKFTGFFNKNFECRPVVGVKESLRKEQRPLSESE